MAGTESKREAARSGEDRDVGGSQVRLPAGRHGLTEEFVTRNQRERIITAMVDMVAEHGYRATTVAMVIDAASVSRRTFYEHFDDKKSCFLEVHEMITVHIRSSMRGATAIFDEWPTRVRAAVATVLRFFAAEPEVARCYVIESVAAGGVIGERHREAIADLARNLRGARPPSREGGQGLPEITEETLLGGTVSLLVREIDAGRTDRLEALVPELVELILTPYLGAEQAGRIARVDPPASSSFPAA